LHISLVELEDKRLELRYWRDNPNDSTPRPLNLAEIADLVRHTPLEYYDMGVPDLLAIGSRLFRWLDGSDHTPRLQLLFDSNGC